MSGLAHELAEVVGERHVLADPELRAPYERDCTGRFGARAALVVRPADTAQVAAALAVCHAHGAPVVPQGGNTGLVGAGVPRGGEVLLSTARLTELGEVDVASAQCTAGAGVTLAALQAHARGAGLDFGLDFGARESATVGGVVATDAGGARALRHGTARAQVAGLEAVLADGTVLSRLAGLPKDNAGYDLPALLVGSEGTLAVITRARMRLVPRLPRRATALIGLASLAAAVELSAILRDRVCSLEALDFFLDDGLELVLRHRRLRPPFASRTPAYAIVECAGHDDPLERLGDALEHAGGVLDVAVADDTARREALWRYREAQPEAIRAEGVPRKLDVGVPPPRLAELERRVRELLGSLTPRARPILFGHLGDGNVHVNLLDVPAEAPVEDEVLRLVAELGGTVSAEHGIGVAKAQWLGLTRSPAEIAAMRAIKRALDPAGLLNPGAVLSPAA